MPKADHCGIVPNSSGIFRDKIKISLRLLQVTAKLSQFSISGMADHTRMRYLMSTLVVISISFLPCFVSLLTQM